MRRVAFATCSQYPDGIEDDALVVSALRRRGLEVAWPLWTDPDVDWSDFAAVLPRTTWDYTARFPEFLAWLDRNPGPVWNPADILRWNARKTYLFDLAAWGVPIIPTVPFSPYEDLGGAMEALGWDLAVVKPVVGAGARNTWRVDARNASAVGLLLRDQGEDMLLQPYVPEIVAGEWSLLYFDGAFSHALRKRPAPGDFRVQAEYGGDVVPEQAPQDMVEIGRMVLEAVGEPLPYARIDLVRTAGGPRLVEAELIEPELFLRTDPGAPERFAEALARRVG